VLHECSPGLTSEQVPALQPYPPFQPFSVHLQATSRALVYGPNTLAIRLKPLLVVLIYEVLTPFYLFQVFR
jgi:hypothetical protein